METSTGYLFHGSKLTATSFLETVSLRLEINMEVAVVMPLCLVPVEKGGGGGGGALLWKEPRVYSGSKEP